jgi:hypothetical protein
MRIWKDRVEETTDSTGTSDLVLTGATVSNQDFGIVGDGNQCDYCVISGDGLAWEVGSGTYDSGTVTLSRDTVYDGSSGPGTKVTLSSESTVFLTFAAIRVGVTSSSGALLPLCTGEFTVDGGPVLVADPFGQCIGVPVP